MRLLSITEFIGHFHPVLVHLPIGILLIALLLQWLSRKEKYTGLKQAVPVILLGGLITAGISCITGYLLSINDDYDKPTVNWHMWMAISVVFVSFILYLKELNDAFAVNKRVLSTGLFILIAVTGHLGGSLTHGSAYLTQPLKDIFTADTAVNLAIRPLANVQEALVYKEVIHPILQAKCSGCHNPGKRKGGLSMDDINELMKGGKNGKVIQPGNAVTSEMIKRLLLPGTNEDHMPPKEKPQPTKNQIELLQWWINNGADTGKKVKELDQPAKMKPILTALQQPAILLKNEPEDFPAIAVEKADEKIIARLNAHNITVVPVSQTSNYLMANFLTDFVISVDDLQLLQQLKKQLVWLRFDHTNMGDSMIAYIKELGNLTRLNVSNTLITDKGLQQFTAFKNLQYLNLAGSKVTATGLMQLKQLTKLKTIYLYNTHIKSTDYPLLKKTFPAAAIDSGGYRVEMLVSDTTEVVKAAK